MNLCIIAILFEKKYYSIQCRYNDISHILYLLKARYTTESAALRFIGLGNLELKVSQACIWKKEKAQVHLSPVCLATYAINSGADDLYVFEDDAWDSIPLIREEILDVA